MFYVFSYIDDTCWCRFTNRTSHQDSYGWHKPIWWWTDVNSVPYEERRGKKIGYLVVNVGFKCCIDMHRTDGIIIQHVSDLDESTVSWGKDMSALRSVYCGLVLCRFLILFIKQLLCQLFFMPTCWLSFLTIVRPFLFNYQSNICQYLAAINRTLRLYSIDIPVCMLVSRCP